MLDDIWKALFDDGGGDDSHPSEDSGDDPHSSEEPSDKGESTEAADGHSVDDNDFAWVEGQQQFLGKFLLRNLFKRKMAISKEKWGLFYDVQRNVRFLLNEI